MDKMYKKSEIGKEINQIYRILLKNYGPQGWWPVKGIYSKDSKKKEKTKNEKTEIIVGAILTQSASWKNVEKALERMREKELIDFEKINSSKQSVIAEIIKPAGYFNQKAKKLKEAAKFFLKNGKNKKNQNKITREKLLEIWGIGPETVDSILLYAYNEPFFVVDAYTKRIFGRLGMIKSKKYDEVQEVFRKNLKKDYEIFNEYHALIVEHAKRFCKAKPLCSKCHLKKICNLGFAA